MAVIWIEPYAGGNNALGFPGGVAGGFAQGDSTTRSQTAPPYPLGTLARDASGNEYTLVKAGAAIAVNEAVRFNAGLGDVRVTSATQQLVFGVADAAFASGDFGWLLTRGSVTCKVVAATAINSLLVTGGTAATLQLATAAEFAGSRGAVQITAEAAGLATVRLS